MTEPLILPTSLDGVTQVNLTAGEAFSFQSETNNLYIRIAMSSKGCSSRAPDPPTVRLRAGDGALTDVNEQIYDYVPDNPGDPWNLYHLVGDVVYETKPDGVFLLYFANGFVTAPANWEWEIEITNEGPEDFYITWVVAENDADSQQPWLDVADTIQPRDELNFGTALIGQEQEEIERILQISNKGTGPLTIYDQELDDSDFEIMTVPGPIPPNSCGDMQIRFRSPNTHGESETIYTIESDGNANTDSNPPNTNPNEFHNKQVRLRATCGRLEIVMVLDASGSMRYTPDGSGPAQNVEDSRWGKMTVAAKQILDLLGDFAGDLGRIGIVIFPDIKEPPETFTESTSRIIWDPDPIPSDLQAIKTCLDEDENTPDAGFGWTPLGQGIATAIVDTAVDSGLFESDGDSIDYNLRWLLVMSDGAHNQGPPDPDDFCGDDDDPTSFEAKKIRVAAVAYGHEGAIHWPPDHAQMQDLATASYLDGVYIYAGADEAGEEVIQAFQTALTSQLALDPAADPGGVLTESAPEIRRQISVLPYDRKVAFVVDWASFDENRVHVQLMTPNCELITPEEAQCSPQIQYHSHPRYAIYTFPHDYLRNVSEPSKPRYGNWTLIISGHGLSDSDSESYEYEVITQSRLNMRLEFNKGQYYAGEAITLNAKLTLYGKPIPNATVTLQLTSPGQSARNWLAEQRITSEEYDKAYESLKGADVTPLAIKAHAVKQKGLIFKPLIRPGTITMTDPDNQGTYSTTYAHTPVPGIYNFHVTAIGETEEGVIFRREKQLQQYLDVRPAPEFTLHHVAYRQISENNRSYLQSDVRVWPKDRFGNTVLVEPEFNPIIELASQTGEATGPLVGNLDGSYSRTFRSATDAKMTFDLRVKGEAVVESQRNLSITRLHYANQILAFEPGPTDKDQNDEHRNPEDALGDFTIKREDQFVNLGTSGSLALGLKDQAVLAGSSDDVVVFVKSDDELRPYQVEALPLHSKDQWIELGTSPGVTSAFSLGKAGLKSVRAIRINDRSRHSASNSGFGSGVNILGVGFEKVGPISGYAYGCLALPVTIIRSLIDWIKK